MRTIEYSTKFKKNWKRISKNSQQTENLEKFLRNAISRLVTDELLEKKMRDHQLIGNYRNCRECHLKPDLLLIYRKHDNVLELVNIGSHSDLFK